MTRRTQTIQADYFDALYDADPDPWKFRTSAYERAKYDATIGCLGLGSYRRGLEIGCAIGVLTRDLFRHCGTLLAIDGSEVALEVARRDCSDLRNVVFERRMVPDGFPNGLFDLIVLSEVLYYLAESDLDAVAARCFGALVPGGTIVLCHWMGLTDYPLTGAQATNRFLHLAQGPRFRHARLADGEYRLDRLIDARTTSGAGGQAGSRHA